MGIYKLALALLTLFMSVGFFRIVKGPTIWDRLLGLNMVSSKLITCIVLVALILEKTYLLDVAMIYALLGFLGILMIARFVKQKGDV
jgi:multicomponent Na+:H+ antiporter subunit F